jgi:predicted metal-dependent hydrolase
MRASSNIMLSSGRSEAALEAALPAPIEIRPMRSARRLRLRFDEASGTLKLTCPWRISRRTALKWALDQRDWIEQQLARAEPVLRFADGAIIPIGGRETRIVWSEKARRTPEFNGDTLLCGGPIVGLERRVESFLKRLALDTMSREAGDYAAAAGVTVSSVSVGDAGSRWGSCSSTGRIRMSWRLILAPPEVRRYVVAHEVAHLRHLNHGAEFKALEARLFGPGLADAKSKLKRMGPRLRLIGPRR